MSTKICTIKETGSRKVDMKVTRFFGGKDIGPCVQLTAKEEDGMTGYIQLSTSDLIALYPILKKHIMDYAIQSKINETQETIDKFQELKKGLLADSITIGQTVINDPYWNMTGLLFWGKKEIEKSDELEEEL